MRLVLPKSLMRRLLDKVRSMIRFLWAPAEPVQIRIVQRDPFRVTVEEWRGSEELCMAAHKALNDPNVRRMLDTLRNSHLGMYDMPADFSSEQRSIKSAVIEGFGIALNTFESLAVHKKPQEPIEATFGAENYERE